MRIFRQFKKNDKQLKARRNEKVFVPLENDAAALNSSLSNTLSILRSRIGFSSDFIIRELGDKIAISYIEGLVDQKQLSELMEALITGNNQFSSFTHNPAF